HQRAERPCRCAQARAKIDSRCDWRIPIESRYGGGAVMLKWQLWWTYIAGSIVVGFVFAALVDCGSFGMPTTPPNVPVDVGDAIACAIADAGAQRSVDDCGQKYGQKLVDDALATLVDSQRFKMEKPEAHKFAMSLRTKPP